MPEEHCLQEDLESKVDRAAALDQTHREVEVDFVRGGENGGRLEVVAHTGKRLGTPLLDELDFDVGSFLKLCRRHDRLSQRCRDTLYSVARPDWISPFYGIRFRELAHSREEFVKDWHSLPVAFVRRPGIFALKPVGDGLHASPGIEWMLRLPRRHTGERSGTRH